MSERRRLLVLGGDDRSLPAWVRRSFDVQHVHRLEKKTGPISRADAIVIITNWCSHKLSKLGSKLAREWGVPAITVHKGWSAVIEEAARRRIDWLVDAVSITADDLLQSPETAQAGSDATTTVDNAWKKAAEHERARADAAERRLGHLRRKLEKTQQALERVRSGAEDRVKRYLQRLLLDSNNRARIARRLREAAADIESVAQALDPDQEE